MPLREGVLLFTSAGGAKPIAGRGGLEGFTPPHRFKARTAASDGQTASTRAARSASINFAVIPLSKRMDREINKVRRLCWHLIHRYRGPPSPHRGRLKRGLSWGETFPVGRLTPLFTLPQRGNYYTCSLSTTSSLLHRIFANIDYNIETKKVYFFGEAK